MVLKIRSKAKLDLPPIPGFYQFWTNFTSVLGLFGERTGLRFPVQPTSLVQFLKSYYNIASDFHRCTNLVSLAIKEKVKVYKHNNNNKNYT